MKRILATAALVSLLAACTAAEDSPTTDDGPDANGSAGPGVEETESPDETSDDTESPDETDTTDAEEGGFGSPGDDEGDAVDFSEFTTDPTESEGFPDLLGSFFPVDARVGGHDGYDRVVIEYDDAEGQLNWAASYTDTPTQDGSGFVVDMEGETFITISVAGVRYPHEDEMGSDSEIVASGLDQSLVVADVNVDFPFEGMHRVHIGVDEERPYRVQTFYEPARLVIDIQNDD